MQSRACPERLTEGKESNGNLLFSVRHPMTAITSPHFDRIALELAAPIGRLSLAHPPANVIDLAMMDELSSALTYIEPKTDISILVVRGAGKGFSAGVDIAAHLPEKIDEMLQRFHAVLRALVNTNKITVAVVHGNCFGGAAELAMVCDIVITSESAVWGFPEIKLGCFPPVAAAALSALIGQKRAADLILTGRSLDGREAAEIGLATASITEEQLDSALQQKLSMLSGLSPSALAIAKKAMYAWDAAHLEKGLARSEKIYCEELVQTQDAEEGIRAFLEKRPPKWTRR